MKIKNKIMLLSVLFSGMIQVNGAMLNGAAPLDGWGEEDWDHAKEDRHNGEDHDTAPLDGWGEEDWDHAKEDRHNGEDYDTAPLDGWGEEDWDHDKEDRHNGEDYDTAPLDGWGEEDWDNFIDGTKVEASNPMTRLEDTSSRFSKGADGVLYWNPVCTSTDTGKVVMACVGLLSQCAQGIDHMSGNLSLANSGANGTLVCSQDQNTLMTLNSTMSGFQDNLTRLNETVARTDGRVASLEDGLNTLNSTVAKIDGEMIIITYAVEKLLNSSISTNLSKRIKKIEGLLESFNNSPGGARTTEGGCDIEILRQNISSLQNTFASFKNELKEEIAKQVNGTVAVTDGKVAGLSTDVSTINGTVTGMDGRVTGLITDVSTLNSTVAGMDGRVTGLSTDVSTINGTVAGIDGKVAGLEGGLNTINSTVAGIDGRVTGLSTDVSTLNRTVADIESRLNQLQERFDSLSLEDHNNGDEVVSAPANNKNWFQCMVEKFIGFLDWLVD